MVVRMERRTGRKTLMVAAVGLLVAMAFAGETPARASTITGRITGTPVPAAGAGKVFVRAVSLQTGEVVAVDDADPVGKYRLTVPKGAFALFPTVVTLTKLFRPKPTKVRLRGGQRKSVRLPARQTAVVLRPIVALPDNAFTGATGEASGLNRGLRDMLITDLVRVKTAACDLTLVERSQRFTDDYKLELALSRSGLADPATAIRPGLLINPTRGVRGTITINSGRMLITAETYKWSSKKTLHRTTVEGAQGEFFQLESVLARRLAALLCEQPPPISGTFSGSLDYAGTGLVGKLDWTGSLELEPFLSGGPTTFYEIRAGTVTAKVRVFGGCITSGEITFSLGPGDAPGRGLEITEGNPDTYRFSVQPGPVSIPTVTSGCPDASDNNVMGLWYIGGQRLLPFSEIIQPFSIANEGVLAGSFTGSESYAGYQWTWSLNG